MNHFGVYAVLVAGLMLICSANAVAQEVLEYTKAQTAVLDPANWDKVFAGERYFDAVRPMLVRFPGMPEQVQAKLEEGYLVEKVELVLTWVKQEGAGPERGRRGRGAEATYTQDPGQWHAVAWPLLRPWSVDNPQLGPTFNAQVNGLIFWGRGGARDETADRLGVRCGPEALHADHPVARLDVTDAFNDRRLGATPGHRLRALEAQGFQVHKQELYDLKYTRQAPGAGHDGTYDWRVSTGYMRIWVEQPKLVFTLRRDESARVVPLPPAVTVTAPPQPVGTPSVAYPANLTELAQRYFTRPEAIPAWQWERIQELHRLGGGYSNIIGEFDAALFSDDRQQYSKQMNKVLAMPPRYFHGHRTPDYATVLYAYGDMLPPAVHDHLKLYWQAFTHPEVEDIMTLPRAPGSFVNYFRGYNRVCGTMNFNYNAIAGTLLAGQLLEAPNVLKDARWGLEHIILRGYGVLDGAHQEIGDTYYQGITLAALGSMVKYARDPPDQLMAEIARDRLVEPLISAYHPGLRRIVHPQGRGGIPLQTLFQDGPYHILHTLSQQGTLIHTDEKFGASRNGVRVFGDDAPPSLISLLSPWGDPSLANVVDEKPLPWRVTARHWQRRSLSEEPGWHINFLGQHYALASREDPSVTPVVGQWRRKAAQVTEMEDLSTLVISTGQNGQVREGWTGGFGLLQHDGKLIAMRSLPERKWFGANAVKSAHASLAVIAPGDTSAREVWINDQRVPALSGARVNPGGDWSKRLSTGGATMAAHSGDVITISDGVTYLGIIPTAVNTAAGAQQVEISFEYPTLLMHTFLAHADTPLDLDSLYADGKATCAGFVLEIADSSEYPTFAAFQAHMRNAQLRTRWDADTAVLHLDYASGADTLTMGLSPVKRQEWTYGFGDMTAYRGINGVWPYLPEGIHRDTPWSVQGMGGYITKGGAVLRTEADRRAYLQVEERAGVYRGYNLLPDPTLLTMSVPGGMSIEADGRLGLTRIVARPGDNALQIDYAPRETFAGRVDMATALLVFGAGKAPSVTLNGAPLRNAPSAIRMDGKTAYVIPLATKLPSRAVLTQRYQRARRLFDVLDTPEVRAGYLQNWSVIGPFANTDKGSGITVAYPPEAAVQLDAVYQGSDDADVRWQRLQPADAAPLGAEPVSVLAPFGEKQNYVGYAATTVTSDRDRNVSLYFGLHNFSRQVFGWVREHVTVFVNGEEVFAIEGCESPGRDGSKIDVRLRRGENTILLKIAHAREPNGYHVLLRIGDAYGFPLRQGLRY